MKTPFDSEIIDWEQCIALANHRADLARELLALLIARLPDELNELDATQQANDASAYRHCVHALYGSCCYVAVPQLSQALAALQASTQSPQHPVTTLLHQAVLAAAHQLMAHFSSCDIRQEEKSS